MRKKWLRTGLSLAICLTTCMSSAFAADFTACADQLHAMGLFQGTGQGYALDRTPTRAEAATMLVRLLGQEQAAQALTYTAPFTDLQGWEKPYVQYLYDNGLTTGTSATAFSPNAPCTAQMYATFLLRALDYDSEQHFKYENALSFAGQIGLYTGADAAVFLRDHVVAASYTALSLPCRDSREDTLLDSLVQKGAVSQTAAAPYQTIFDTYHRYQEAGKQMDNLSAFSIQHKLTLKSNALTAESTETIQVNRTIPERHTIRSTTLSDGTKNQTQTTETYIADNTYYLLQNGVASRQHLTSEAFQQAFMGYTLVPVALLQTITEENNTYTIQFNEAGMRHLNSLLTETEAPVTDLRDLKISDFSLKQTVSDGHIISQNASLSVTSVVGRVSTFSGTLTSVMTLEQTGDAVQITPPAHLDTYPEVNPQK